VIQLAYTDETVAESWTKRVLCNEVYVSLSDLYTVNDGFSSFKLDGPAHTNFTNFQLFEATFFRVEVKKDIFQILMLNLINFSWNLAC
jgi:hypothetical protein